MSDDTEFSPYEIDWEEVLKNENITQISCGTQFLVMLSELKSQEEQKVEVQKEASEVERMRKLNIEEEHHLKRPKYDSSSDESGEREVKLRHND